MLVSESSFREKVNIYKNLTHREREFLENADAEQLKALLEGCLADAKGQRADHQENKSFLRKVGSSTVVFVHNFHGFLNAFSGELEAMQAADSQYGGLAYSTLSMLLMVRKSVAVWHWTLTDWSRLQ